MLKLPQRRIDGTQSQRCTTSARFDLCLPSHAGAVRLCRAADVEPATADASQTDRSVDKPHSASDVPVARIVARRSVVYEDLGMHRPLGLVFFGAYVLGSASSLAGNAALCLSVPSYLLIVCRMYQRSCSNLGVANRSRIYNCVQHHQPCSTIGYLHCCTLQVWMHPFGFPQ